MVTYDQRQRVDLLPSNPLSKGLHYISERQTELKAFLSNPYVLMDTNHLERALRVIPMGRKNYLFCWTELGAEQLGILQPHRHLPSAGHQPVHLPGRCVAAGRIASGFQG